MKKISLVSAFILAFGNFFNVTFTFAYTFTLAFVLPQFFYSMSQAQTASQIKIGNMAYREYKITLSRQLGVTCNECHDTNNFTKGDKINYKKGKEHMKLTQLLIDNGFDGEKGHPKADCYMCHRGKLKPDYHEPKDAMLGTPHLGSPIKTHSTESEKESEKQTPAEKPEK